MCIRDSAKAGAFAEAAGVEQAKIAELLRGLTPVVLRADTRVTNHGLRDGHPYGFQSVLQAGTAVLVDGHGMPRVRCACGNPLLPPRGTKGSPVFKGEQWSGFHPNQVIVIEPTVQPMGSLVIANLANNTWIERTTGDDGAQDRTPQLLPAHSPADGILSGAPSPAAPARPSGPATPPATPAPPRTPPRATPPRPDPWPESRPDPWPDSLGDAPVDIPRDQSPPPPDLPADPGVPSDPDTVLPWPADPADPYDPDAPAGPYDPDAPAGPHEPDDHDPGGPFPVRGPQQPRDSGVHPESA